MWCWSSALDDHRSLHPCHSSSLSPIKLPCVRQCKMVPPQKTSRSPCNSPSAQFGEGRVRRCTLLTLYCDWQVCCAGAYFKSPNQKLKSPHIFVLGYRSPKLQLDFRTNDLGIFFKDIHTAPLESRFSVTAVGPSHTVEVI